MNKSRHPNLPSISTLLTNTSQPPSSPPRIIVVIDDQQRQEEEEREEDQIMTNNNSLLLSPRYLSKSISNDHLSVTLSPILSPIDSYASSINSLSPNSATTPNSFQPPSPLPSPSMLSLPTNHSLPASLQGDDPPRRLSRHPSISSITSITNTSPRSSFNNAIWTNNSCSNTPNSSISQSFNSNYSPSPSSSYYAPSSSPPQRQQQPAIHLYQRQAEDQSDHNSPMMMSIDSSRSPSPSPSIASSSQQLPPSTQIVINESGQPIIKRRRGRPPNMREPALEGGWTFLTPTVWDVNHSASSQQQHQQQQHQQQQQDTTNNSHTINPLSATSQATSADSIMSDSMAAFTSSNMDIVLQMPRKKRGRKPKTHIVGNSCFVWKDITATRRSTKVIKDQQNASTSTSTTSTSTTSTSTTSTSTTSSSSTLRRLEPNNNK